jgi:ferredoxin
MGNEAALERRLRQLLGNGRCTALYDGGAIFGTLQPQIYCGDSTSESVRRDIQSQFPDIALAGAGEPQCAALPSRLTAPVTLDCRGYPSDGPVAALVRPDGNAIPVGKDVAGRAFDAATCIGCGACVAACPNASPSLFLGAKVTQYALLPQGQAERVRRVIRMVDQMDKDGFGSCTNIGECTSSCPKEISLEHIAILKREYARAAIMARPEKAESGPG